jgi:hypothetical protein
MTWAITYNLTIDQLSSLVQQLFGHFWLLLGSGAEYSLQFWIWIWMSFLSQMGLRA